MTKSVNDPVIKESEETSDADNHLLMRVCGENTNDAPNDPTEVILFDGVEYRAGGTYVDDTLTFDTSKGHPGSGVRLIEFLRNLDATGEMVEVKKEEIGGGEGEEVEMNHFDPALSPSRSGVQLMLEGNRSVVVRFTKATESSGDATTDGGTLESAGGKKTRVRRRGIIGTRKTILQTKKFRLIPSHY